MKIEQKIKELARNKGIPIRQLCKRIGMTNCGFIISLRNDVMKISTLRKVAIELGVDICYFFNDQPVPEQKKQVLIKPLTFLAKAFDDVEELAMVIDAKYFKSENSEDALKIAAQIHLVGEITRLISILQTSLKY